jgi:hypothetical protein
MRGLPNHSRDRMPGVAYGPLLAVAAVGAVVSAAAAARQGQIQAGVAKQNATLAENNATIQATAGAQAQQQQGIKTGQEVGDQEAEQAAGGINTASASAQNVLAGTRQAGVLDQSNLRFSTGVGVQNDQQQAGQFKQQAANDSTGGYISAGSSILGGASSLGNSYLQFQKFGTPTAASMGLPNFGTNS